MNSTRKTSVRARRQNVMTFATVRILVEGFCEEPTGTSWRPCLCLSAASESAMFLMASLSRSVLVGTCSLSQKKSLTDTRYPV